ncbi:GlsB/YeaQ/YmgE family stress response membrane protein [Niabella aurantiaca]|uniref:GlsB/YeaQ/YmgE family stress response membrane protein n=1 Tax=Niabella aurantiaca TaxID=379900 RepID=UPI00037CFEA1|nr:GlsB/YeaQ/YmgE family stress response membrane protein [Niabella aurantiaca]
MDLLSRAIFGLIAGIVAKALYPHKDPGGGIVTILIGIAGALIGGWIGNMIGWRVPDGFDIRSFILAIAGSVPSLWLYNRAIRNPDI